MRPRPASSTLTTHCVGNVGWNQMNPWVKFYEDAMGFPQHFELRRQGYLNRILRLLMSKVMSNGKWLREVSN